MKRKVFFVAMLGVVWYFGLVVVGCDNGNGGGDGIITPNIINGYYGVTSDGKTIEVIFTPSPSNRNASRSITVYNSYVIKIDGVVVSVGTVTNTGGTITFTPTDGSTVTPTLTGEVLDSISVTSSDGITYSADMNEAADFYYSIGAATYMTLAECQALINGKTPEQVYQYCWGNTELFLDDPDDAAGTFDDMVAFGRSHSCPDAEISRVAKELNSGKISGVGCYSYSENGYTYNIMFFVSKVPLN
jgi:hypothetical protein